MLLMSEKYKAPATANMAKQKISFNTVNIKETGYLYVYLSYEGAGTNWVYFDDMKITHTKTNVVQYNEYYPFGLQANSSWTRDNTTANNFLYNEASEINTTTNWYDLPYRNYDPALGRFIQIDPLASNYGSLSPYHYSNNNPVMFNDPSGMEYGSDGPKYGPPAPDPSINPLENGVDPSEFGNSCYSCNNGEDEARFNDEPNYLGLCPSCPKNDPRYAPFIKDEKHVWRYDPVTGAVILESDVTVLDEVTITNTPDRKPQIQPGDDLIRQYEQNEKNAWAMLFTGYAFLENGIGGNYLEKIRNNISLITNPDKKKDIEKANQIMDLATQFVKTGLTFVKGSKHAEVYTSITGSLLVLKGTALQFKNDNSLGPKIMQINPDYYNQNIQRIYPPKLGGGGSSDDY